MILPNKFVDFPFVVGADKLPDNLLGDVSTDIFIVVAFAPHLLLLYFFENM